jgi:ABC-type histidine transport system ATPase subunit
VTAIVEARALRKRFGEVEALAGLDLVAVSGQVTALLGGTRSARDRAGRPVGIGGAVDDRP